MRGPASWTTMGATGSAANRAAADDCAARVLPRIREMQLSGVVRHTCIAAALNAEGIRAPRGGVWTAAQVLALLRRG